MAESASNNHNFFGIQRSHSAKFPQVKSIVERLAFHTEQLLGRLKLAGIYAGIKAKLSTLCCPGLYIRLRGDIV